MNLIRDLANQDVREIKSGKSVVGTKMDCGVVITAEFFPDCEQSTRTRCLRIKLQNPIPNDAIYPFQQTSSRLTLVFEEFIRRVAEQYITLVGQVTSDFNDYRSRRSQDNSHAVPSERLAEIGFFLYESLNVLLLLFPRGDCEDILSQFQDHINRWLVWQLSPEAAPELRDIIFALPQVYQKYPQFFLEHHGCLCITPDNLCMLLQEYYKDKTIDRDYVLKYLQNRGVLAKDKSGAATKKIGGRRYLHIRQKQL